MKIKAIICDVGGVFVRSGDTSRRQVWEKRFGLAPGQLSELVYRIEPADRATIGAVKSEMIWKDIGAKFSLSAEEVALLSEDFFAGDVFNQEFYAFMKRQRLKHRTAILSNAWENARIIYSHKYKLDELFDVMVISAEVGMQKPDKRIFHYTLDLLGIHPSESIFIDDMIENCNAAEAIGMKAIFFSDTDTVVQEMKKVLIRTSYQQDFVAFT